MSRANVTGAVFCLLVFMVSFIVTGNAAAYLNLVAFLVVVSGTFGATLLSFPYKQIKTALYVARGAYKTKVISADEIIGMLLDLSVRSRVDGTQSVEEAGEHTTVFFLRDAVRMLVDNYPEEEIRDILMTEIFFFKLRRQHSERVFRVMATYSPAFGLAGSVIGLIGLLIGLGDTGEVLKYIPIALISTLYGILFANFVLSPIAEAIRDKTEQEVLVQKVIIEGVVAIKTETNPHILEKRLSSFLTPASRLETHQSFADIRKKHIQMVRARQQAAKQPPPPGPPSGEPPA